MVYRSNDAQLGHVLAQSMVYGKIYVVVESKARPDLLGALLLKDTQGNIMNVKTACQLFVEDFDNIYTKELKSLYIEYGI